MFAHQHRDDGAAPLNAKVTHLVTKIVELAHDHQIARHNPIDRLAHGPDLARGVEAEGNKHHRDRGEAEKDAVCDRNRHGTWAPGVARERFKEGTSATGAGGR
ncbi:hypothetical protein MMMDOFMJ_3911 [Methylobacterium gnaphalii]|nr:hypothetical protein MMMDOFMJ_3911 [Methylobacterium gnaphalii]